MAKTYVLDRVAADLARGSTHPAIQRLSSLVAAYPNDLDLRRRLAAVHRRVGNRIQAGRWDYLTIGADRRDTGAFERAFPSAVTRLREVRWPYRASHAATAYARGRLAKLMAAAAAEQPAVRAATRRAAAVGAATGAAAAVQATRGAAAVRSVASRAAVAAAGGGRLAIRFTTAMQWFTDRSRRPATILAVTAAALVMTPLVAVGLVTVVQWFV
jgi:hypothetical protein